MFNTFKNVRLNIEQGPGHLLKEDQEQLSPEDQKRVFGGDKLKTAYQSKKRSLRLTKE